MQRLEENEVTAALAALPGWRLADGAIEKTFEHASFGAAMAFANAVAWIAEREDHHPRMQIDWRRCTLRWSTHDAGGLTQRDLRCAALVDALLAP